MGRGRPTKAYTEALDHFIKAYGMSRPRGEKINLAHLYRTIRPFMEQLGYSVTPESIYRRNRRGNIEELTNHKVMSAEDAGNVARRKAGRTVQKGIDRKLEPFKDSTDLTPKEIAEMAGVSYSSVRRRRMGEPQPPSERLAQILQAQKNSANARRGKKQP